MENDETVATAEANAEAAFAVEFASSAALHGLTVLASKEVTRMAWLLGYCKGRSDGLLEARTMIEQSQA